MSSLLKSYLNELFEPKDERPLAKDLARLGNWTEKALEELEWSFYICIRGFGHDILEDIAFEEGVYVESIKKDLYTLKRYYGEYDELFEKTFLVATMRMAKRWIRILGEFKKFQECVDELDKYVTEHMEAIKNRKIGWFTAKKNILKDLERYKKMMDSYDKLIKLGAKKTANLFLMVDFFRGKVPRVENIKNIDLILDKDHGVFGSDQYVLINYRLYYEQDENINVDNR